MRLAHVWTKGEKNATIYKVMITSVREALVKS